MGLSTVGFQVPRLFDPKSKTLCSLPVLAMMMPGDLLTLATGGLVLGAIALVARQVVKGLLPFVGHARFLGQVMSARQAIIQRQQSFLQQEYTQNPETLKADTLALQQLMIQRRAGYQIQKAVWEADKIKLEGHITTMQGMSKEEKECCDYNVEQRIIQYQALVQAVKAQIKRIDDDFLLKMNDLIDVRCGRFLTDIETQIQKQGYGRSANDKVVAADADAIRIATALGQSLERIHQEAAQLDDFYTRFVGLQEAFHQILAAQELQEWERRGEISSGLDGVERVVALAELASHTSGATSNHPIISNSVGVG